MGLRLLPPARVYIPFQYILGFRLSFWDSGLLDHLDLEEGKVHWNRACLRIRQILAARVPSKKILHWANVCCVAHETHATEQPCRHTKSEEFPTL